MSAWPLSKELVPPPDDAPDVCGICRSWREPGAELCNNCTENRALLGGMTQLVPVSLYRKPSTLRDWLTYYKANDEEQHPEYANKVAEILREWLAGSGAALDEYCAGYDAVCVVPSASRPTPHPLEVLIDQHVPALAARRQSLLKRGAGEVGHRHPSLDAYTATTDLQGRRILLVDDVYTTGARSQSAAHALRASGAEVPAILAIGRRVNPEWRAEVAVLWERQARLPFTFPTQFA